MSPRFAASAGTGDACGTEVSFVCGSFTQFSMCIDARTRKVSAAAFRTNGCGFMISAADVLAEWVTGRYLTDLHGLDSGELFSVVEAGLGPFEEGRRHCIECAVNSLRLAFADYRTRQIEEFGGEKAIICTCFGVLEETVEKGIQTEFLRTVEDVTRACGAGGGCGSCRMLIQEMIDSSQHGL